MYASNYMCTLQTTTLATLGGQIDTSGLTILCLPGKASLISACSPAYVGFISQEFQMRAAWPVTLAQATGVGTHWCTALNERKSMARGVDVTMNGA